MGLRRGFLWGNAQRTLFSFGLSGVACGVPEFGAQPTDDALGLLSCAGPVEVYQPVQNVAVKQIGRSAVGVGHRRVGPVLNVTLDTDPPRVTDFAVVALTALVEMPAEDLWLSP